MDALLGIRIIIHNLNLICRQNQKRDPNKYIRNTVPHVSHLDYNPNPNIIENIVPLFAFGL